MAVFMETDDFMGLGAAFGASPAPTSETPVTAARVKARTNPRILAAARNVRFPLDKQQAAVPQRISVCCLGGDQLPVRVAREHLARKRPDVRHLLDALGIAGNHLARPVARCRDQLTDE